MIGIVFLIACIAIIGVILWFAFEDRKANAKRRDDSSSNIRQTSSTTYSQAREASRYNASQNRTQSTRAQSSANSGGKKKYNLPPSR